MSLHSCPLLAPMTRRLGMGALAAGGAGSGLVLLDRLRRAGGPVPDGIVILHEASVRAEREGLTAAPARLAAQLGLPWGRGGVVVRAACSAEDRTDVEDPLAGGRVAWVEAADVAAIGAAVIEAWASAARLPAAFHHDVLVVHVDEPRRVGTAFLESGRWGDVIASWPAIGDAEARQVVLPQLLAGERSHEAAPFARRLQRALVPVRRILGTQHGWRVDWVDDGRRCTVVGVTHAPVPMRRNDRLVAVLPGEQPAPLLAGLVVEAVQRRWESRTAMLPGAGRRPVAELILGRAYANATLVDEVRARLGLPTSFAGPRPVRLLRSPREVIAFTSPGRAPVAPTDGEGLRAGIDSLREALQARLPPLPLQARPWPCQTPAGSQVAGPLAARLAALADEAVRRGLLTDPGDLELLTVAEAERLADGWRPPEALLAHRHGERAEHAAFRLPAIVHRLDDLERFRRPAATPIRAG